MAKQEKTRIRLVTDAGRLSFPNLFEPRDAMADGTKFAAPRYDATLIIPPDAPGLPELRKAISKILVDTWGPNWKEKVSVARLPLKPVDTTKTYYSEEFAGWFTLSASNIKEQPGLVDQDRQPILNQRDLYAGCWARFQIQLYPYDAAGNRGVSAALDNVQKLADGDRFGGATPSAASAFDGVGVTLPPQALRAAASQAESPDDMF